MMTQRLGTAFKILVLGALAAAGCGGTESPPTGFGVNLTVDATMIPAATRAKITSAKLTVTSDDAGMSPVSRTPADLPKALQGGTARFHYTPGAGITKNNKLTFVVDAFNGTTLVATGTSPAVQLAAEAVSATITLKGGADGGVPDGATDAQMEASPGDVVNPDGAKNGATCTTNAECGTGFCTDGVCCNEKCDDVCASCNLTGHQGVCTPYDVDTDPEMECGPVQPPTESDAGTAGDGSAGDASQADAGAAGDGASSADAESDAAVINTPDGGFMTMPKSCGGKCSGARSCKFPGMSTSCGKAFCNTKGQAASFVCDGMGGCAPSLTACTSYACNDATGTCDTSCQAHTQCVSTNYCAGDQTCKPKKGNGLTCVTSDECTSGHCIGAAGASVCCNTACESPLTCTMAGAVGQCKCSECPNGTCQVFYPDKDGDGYGDRTATYAANTAKAACTGVAPVGFVADNTDCDDGDSNVHPGQTAFFATKSRNGTGTFDYNCDGVLTKKTPEYVGGSCKFCGAVGACSLVSATCSAANQASSFQCPQEFYTPIIKGFSSEIDATIPRLAVPGRSEPLASSGDIVPLADPAVAIPILPGRLECCGCLANDRTGYLTTVACGASATTYTCNPCAGVNQGPAAATATAGVVQNCR
jgi:hypothetical protein